MELTKGADDSCALSLVMTNRVLDALPHHERAHLFEGLVSVPVAPREILQRAREPVNYVYFPTAGAFSIIMSLPEGVSVECATVGNEGMLGIEAFLSETPIASAESILRVPEGRVQRVDAA